MSIKKNIHKNSKWKPEYDDFLKENYRTKGHRWCAKQLGFSDTWVCIKGGKLGLRLTREEKSDITTEFDASIFESPITSEVCYILGLIYADGHLEPAKYSQIVKLCLVTEDFNTIEKCLIKTGNWHISESYPKNRKPIKWARCSNKRLWNFLVSHNYLHKSGGSADKILSKIPNHLRYYWWRGFFDGDGWFTFKKGKKYCFGFSACWKQDWNFVIRLFKKLNIIYQGVKQNMVILRKSVAVIMMV